MKLKGIVIGFDTNKTKENISSKRNPPFSPPKNTKTKHCHKDTWQACTTACKKWKKLKLDKPHKRSEKLIYLIGSLSSSSFFLLLPSALSLATSRMPCKNGVYTWLIQSTVVWSVVLDVNWCLFCSFNDWWFICIPPKN